MERSGFMAAARKSALKPLLNRALPYAVLLMEVLVFHRRILFYFKWSIPFDLRSYHLPLAFHAAESLGAGVLPLWDPDIYCGFPFYANIQTQLFYPPAWPFFALANLFGTGSLAKLLEWQTALHVFLGGAFAYALLRKMNLRRGPALLGATIFQLGGYFPSQAQHLGAMCGAAWLPLAWLGVLSLAERFSWRWLAGLSFALAMSLLAGFPATAIIVFGSTMLLAVLLIVFRSASPKLLVPVAAASLWAVLLSAVQLLPTLMMAPLSTASLRAEWHIAGGVPLQSLVSLVIPNYYHIFDPDKYTAPYSLTFMYVYCGLAGLALALLAVLPARRKPEKIFALMTVLSCIWMLGSKTPLIGSYYAHIPGFIRGPMYPEFAMAAFSLGMAVLAAFGAERLGVLKKRAAMATLLLIAVVDLTFHGAGRVMNTGRTIDDIGVTPTHFEGSSAALTTVRDLVTQSAPPARIDVIRGSRNWSTSANITHLPSANGDEPLALLRILKLRSCFTDGLEWERYYLVSKPDSRVIDLLNVRYLLARDLDGKAPAGKPNLPVVGTAGDHTVYENPNFLPRFFLAAEVRHVRDFTESLSEVCSPSFDPARVTVVEGAGDLNIPPGASPAGSVRAVQYSPHLIELEVNTPSPSFVVSSETWYPGWRAEVNGRETPIWMTNAAFRGVAVPAGSSRVTMSFHPPDLFYGGLVSAADLAGARLRFWSEKSLPTRNGRRREIVCHIDFIKRLMLLEVMPLKEPLSFELTVPSRLEEMTAVHALVEEAIKEFKLSEELAHWIELTVSESMINAIQHGNKLDPGKKATLKMSSNGDAIEVIVEDEGKGFELCDIADPTNVENLLKPSGRGILIIRSFMDEVDVTRREGGGSRLRMLKRIPKEDAS